MFNGFPRPVPDSGSNIEVTQRGTTTFPTSVTTHNVTINEVNLDKDIVVVFSKPGTGSGSVNAIACELTTKTNILFNKNAALTGTQPVSWQIIRFNNAKSKQTGTTAVSSTPVNVTINPVNLEKVLLFISFTTTSTGFDYINANFTSPTNLQLTSYSNTSVKWQIVELR